MLKQLLQARGILFALCRGQRPLLRLVDSVPDALPQSSAAGRSPWQCIRPVSRTASPVTIGGQCPRPPSTIFRSGPEPVAMYSRCVEDSVPCYACTRRTVSPSAPSAWRSQMIWRETVSNAWLYVRYRGKTSSTTYGLPPSASFRSGPEPVAIYSRCVGDSVPCYG